MGVATSFFQVAFIADVKKSPQNCIHVYFPAIEVDDDGCFFLCEDVLATQIQLSALAETLGMKETKLFESFLH